MRIVSLLPSATELIGELGLLDHLVGVSHACDTPASVQALPRLTGTDLPYDAAPATIDAAVSASVAEGRPLYRVNADAFAALRPELVVTQGLCEVCAVHEDELAHALRRVAALDGIPVLSLDARSVAAVWDDLRRLADAVEAVVPGTRTRAEARIADVAAVWSALPGPRSGGPRVVALEWPDPPFSGGHWVPEQVAAAGAVDPIGAPGVDSRRLRWEEIEAADPDVIVSIACGYGLDGNAAFAANLYRDPSVPPLRALHHGDVLAMDANADFSRPALGLVRGASRLHTALTGGPPDPHGWRWVRGA